MNTFWDTVQDTFSSKFMFTGYYIQVINFSNVVSLTFSDKI